jgi:hypothetical protein
MSPTPEALRARAIWQSAGKALRDVVALVAPEALRAPETFLVRNGWRRAPPGRWLDYDDWDWTPVVALRVQLLRTAVTRLRDAGWTVTAGSWNCACPPTREGQRGDHGEGCARLYNEVPAKGIYLGRWCQ